MKQTELDKKHMAEAERFANRLAGSGGVITLLGVGLCCRFPVAGPLISLGGIVLILGSIFFLCLCDDAFGVCKKHPDNSGST